MVSPVIDPDVVDPVERRARGLKMSELVLGHPMREPQTRREETLVDFVFAEVWSRAFHGVLGLRERRLLVLSALASLNAELDLERHIYGAIASGDLNLAELNEWISQLAVYSGWSVAETADRMVHEQWQVVHAERGVPLPPAPTYEPAAEPEDQEQRKLLGEQHYRIVNWTPEPPRTVPFFKDGILNFVFSKMWSHPGLTRRERRIITLACVSVADSVQPVQSHVFGALRSGELSYEEAHECVLLFAAYAGWPKASFLLGAIEQQTAIIRAMNCLISPEEQAINYGASSTVSAE
jgi:4-carboxymuconolactone decarboxylase